jgi:hypothetical protein
MIHIKYHVARGISSKSIITPEERPKGPSSFKVYEDKMVPEEIEVDLVHV